MNSRKRLTPDVIAGLVLAAAGAFATYQAAKLPFGSIAQPDSGFFPLCTAVLITLFAVSILAAPAAASAGEPLPERPSWAVGATVAALIAYVFLLKPAGFLLCTAVLLILMLRALGGMRWLRAFAIAAPAVIACYVLFTRLGVPLPAGILGV